MATHDPLTISKRKHQQKLHIITRSRQCTFCTKAGWIKSKQFKNKQTKYCKSYIFVSTFSCARSWDDIKAIGDLKSSKTGSPHVCGTKMMFFELVNRWDRYLYTCDNVPDQGICDHKLNPFIFWYFCQKMCKNHPK